MNSPTTLTRKTWKSIGNSLAARMGKGSPFHDELNFLTEFIRNPTRTGSVCPSSHALGAALASEVPPDGKGLVIDLGAGDGPVTTELLRAGIAPERVVAVELSEILSRAYARRHKDILLIKGDAVFLRTLLDRHAPGLEVSAIVSSLPFSVMPGYRTRSILREVRSLMKERGGVLIQYTYAWWERHPLESFGFSPRSSRVVLRNLPPARVEAYIS